jgi:hypothetical protein
MDRSPQQIAMAWLALRAQSARLPVLKGRYPFVSANTYALAADLYDSTSGCSAARENLEQ